MKEKIKIEKQKGELVLLTSHILDDLDELSTHILYIMDGQIQILQEFLGTGAGMAFAVVVLLLWVAMPMFFAFRIFGKKDL